ncbi:MAG: hypothetical protein IT463_11015 [Planctomycetes bacterium]|nr:hypothetical protein [Planctomycetota bacterium]
MRSVSMFGLVALSMVLTTTLCAAEDTNKGVKWLSSLDEAKKQATESKKQIYIEFTAEW